MNLGVIGCGDVAVRTYMPMMQQHPEAMRVAACFDVQADRAQQAAAMFEGAAAYTTLEELLGHEGLDAVVNLTPAPFHRDVNAAALDAGLHVYSEKPLASTVEDGRALIETARERGLLFLVAPSVMVSRRFRWLKQELAEGRIGTPTLATAQIANLGPANWTEYTGDVAVFYGAAVGPLIDQGVYILHAVTGLLGPARRVQAMGGTAIPERTSYAGGGDGRQIAVETEDHMLIQLEFGPTTWAQILSSYAVPRTQAPTMEVHGTAGSISIRGADWYDANGEVDLFAPGEGPSRGADWERGVRPPDSEGYSSMIAGGVVHLAACLNGQEQPILTADHGLHILEIILRAKQSAQDGRTLDLETTF